MKAHIREDDPVYIAHNRYGLNLKEWQAVRETTNKVIEEKFDDLANRCCMVMCYAMMMNGLKASTINKAIDRYFSDVQPMFAHYKQDNTADWVVFDKLRDYGVKVNMTKEEM